MIFIVTVCKTEFSLAGRRDSRFISVHSSVLLSCIHQSYCPVSISPIVLYPSVILSCIHQSCCPVFISPIVLYPSVLLSCIHQSYCPVSTSPIVLYPSVLLSCIHQSYCPVSISPIVLCVSVRSAAPGSVGWPRSARSDRGAPALLGRPAPAPPHSRTDPRSEPRSTHDGARHKHTAWPHDLSTSTGLLKMDHRPSQGY